MIIVGGAVICKTVQQITAKILALSITEMRFLNMVIEKVVEILIGAKVTSEDFNAY